MNTVSLMQLAHSEQLRKHAVAFETLYIYICLVWCIFKTVEKILVLPSDVLMCYNLNKSYGRNIVGISV